jgi:hypothetical protein
MVMTQRQRVPAANLLTQSPMKPVQFDDRSVASLFHLYQPRIYLLARHIILCRLLSTVTKKDNDRVSVLLSGRI